MRRANIKNEKKSLLRVAVHKTGFANKEYGGCQTRVTDEKDMHFDVHTLTLSKTPGVDKGLQLLMFNPVLMTCASERMKPHRVSRSVKEPHCDQEAMRFF